MALSASTMADTIIAKMPVLDEQAARDARRAAVLAFCEGMIEHFQTFAELNGTLGFGLANSGGPVAGQLTTVGPVIK